MFVCNCNGLTETQIIEAIDAGVDDSVKTLEYHGCVPRCCGCLNRICRMIEDKKETENVEEQPSSGILAQTRANITTS
ncbi:MAG: hypothetical protein JXR12_05645 [Neptunomonas phycophila]|uniref:(2Fe-2S)-binding protein n=1 Tax=Neptunomonas phycophila TaxID=1572645 RepID=UPI003B8D688F